MAATFPPSNTDTIGEPSPRYFRVFLTFARNSLVRDMTFRGNLFLETIAAIAWVLMNVGFYEIIFHYTDSLGANTGWGKYQFLIFFATTTIINSIVEAFFMSNAEELSELIRTGGLDFALLKPIDTQFLVSLQKIDWSSLANMVVGGGLLGFAVWKLHSGPEPVQIGLLQIAFYPFYVLCGVVIFYSLMIALAATSIWLGRNQSLQQFWFYITIFSRYPMEIYNGPTGHARQWAGRGLWAAFTFIVPVLVAVNVPARLLARPLTPDGWWLSLFAIVATLGSFWVSRKIFHWALASYRSASS